MVYKIWLFYFCTLSTFLLGESYGFGRLFIPRTRPPAPRPRASSPPSSPSLSRIGAESFVSGVGEHTGAKVVESLWPRSEESSESSGSRYSNWDNQPNRFRSWGAREESGESSGSRYWNNWPNRYSSWEAPYSNRFMPGSWNPYGFGGGPGYLMGR